MLLNLLLTYPISGYSMLVPKRLLSVSLLTAGVLCYSQAGNVGINTDNPRATLDVVGRTITDADKQVSRGVIFPHISDSQKSQFKDKTEGLMIWNTDRKCVDVWNGSSWSCLDAGTTSSNTKKNPTLPDGFTINEGRYFIASVHDTDYLPYTRPTGPAVWTSVAADNTQETPVVNLQGTVPADGINIQIPITVTENSTLNAFTSDEIAIHPEGEQDVTNSTRTLVLSWEQQSVTTTTKSITAKIKPTNNQLLNVKKLDINGGVGSDARGTLLATFSLPKSNLSITDRVDFELRVIAGIPDKRFSTQTGGQHRHEFLYLPIAGKGSDGKYWLSNNLGAAYSKLNSSDFNVLKNATSPRDHKAYGSLFQWGRDADGHELVNWTSSTSGSWDYPAAGWYSNPYDGKLSYTTGKDPCPSGWYTPTSNELLELQTAIVGRNTTLNNKTNSNKVWDNKVMNFVASGSRAYNNGSSFSQVGNYGYLWSSNSNRNGYASGLFFRNWDSYVDSNIGRPYGLGVRCLKK